MHFSVSLSASVMKWTDLTDLGTVTSAMVLGAHAMGKPNFISALKQLFKPKVGSARWFSSFPKMTTQELKDIRKAFWERLFDPNEDVQLRWRIRDKILPYIDKILRNRDEYYTSFEGRNRFVCLI